MANVDRFLFEIGGTIQEAYLLDDVNVATVTPAEISNLSLTVSPTEIPAGAAAVPIADIPAAAIPLRSIPLRSSIDLSAAPLRSIPLRSIAIAATPLRSIPLRSIDIDSTPLRSIPLRSIVLSSLPLRSIPLRSIPLRSIDLDASPLRSILLKDLAAPNNVVDCGVMDCTSTSTQTLGNAADADAIRLGATLDDIIDNLDPFVFGDLNFYDDVTLGDIAEFGDTTIGDLIDHAAEAVGDMTLADILIGLLLASDYPWEELPLDEMGVQLFAGTEQTLHYTLSFTNTGEGPALDPVVSVELPDGFVYLPGSSRLTVGTEATPTPIPDPAGSGPLRSLTWHLEGTEVPPDVRLQLDFQALPGLQLGIFSASASVAADEASASVDNHAPVQVTENFEPNDDPATAPVAEPDVLYISHISSATDKDFWRIPVPEEPGSRIGVYLSHLGSDNDLVMYSPASAPLRSIPLRSIPLRSIPVEDDGLNVDDSGSALPPETLQDISLESLPLRSISANRSTHDEFVQTRSRGETGFYTIQVSGYNGSFSDQPYVLRIKVTPPPTIECTPRTFPYVGTPGTIPTPIPSDVNTLFIVNQERLGDVYGAAAASSVMTALNTLAAHADVKGVVIPVEDNSYVATAYEAWDLKPCSATAANNVVTEISYLIYQLQLGLPDLRFIVIVGSDEIVPMARIPDLTQVSNESDYALDLAFADDNALYGSLATANILSDDAYGDFDPIPLAGPPALRSRCRCGPARGDTR